MSELPAATCGDCIAFRGEEPAADGHRQGACRLRPELGHIPDTLDACPSLQLRASRIGEVRTRRVEKAPEPRHRSSGPRRDEPDEDEGPRRATLGHPVTGDTRGEIVMDRNGLKQVLRELLEEETLYGYPVLGRRWQGGTIVLKPADTGLQAKELPLETFFHKIVMIRDRLRVLEQKINSNEKLAPAEKIELQGYVSKAYGTLTTFNVLFRDRQDQFSSKDEE